MINTARLTLEPLRVDHAAELAPALDDAELHRHIGGQPATLEQLHSRYEALVMGHSPDGAQGWLNWVVRRRGTGAVVGTVQATLDRAAGGMSAGVAWVIALPYQGQGFAGEASDGMVGWLRQQGVHRVIADIHPGHKASIGVARRLGLTATDVVVDGEVRWSS